METSQSQRKSHFGDIPTGIYQIVNVHTSAYAGLLNDNDRSEIVNLTLGLGDHGEQGLTVRTDRSFKRPLVNDWFIVAYHIPPTRRVYDSECRLSIICELRSQPQTQRFIIRQVVGR